MNRLLMLASGGLFATSLAILPLSVFAQQTDTAVTIGMKPVTPATQQTGNADAKSPTPAVRTTPITKQTIVAKHVNLHQVKHVTTPSAGLSSHAVRAATPATGSNPMVANPTSSSGVPSMGAAKPATVNPAVHATTGVPSSPTPSTTQPKVIDQSKS